MNRRRGARRCPNSTRRSVNGHKHLRRREGLAAMGRRRHHQHDGIARREACRSGGWRQRERAESAPRHWPRHARDLGLRHARIMLDLTSAARRESLRRGRGRRRSPARRRRRVRLASARASAPASKSSLCTRIVAMSARCRSSGNFDVNVDDVSGAVVGVRAQDDLVGAVDAGARRIGDRQHRNGLARRSCRPTTARRPARPAASGSRAHGDLAVVMWHGA